MSFLSAAPILAESGWNETLRNLLNNPTVMLGIWGVLVFIFIVIPLWFAVFLHIATRWFGLKKSLGIAFLTVILDWVLGATFNIGLALFGVNHLASASWAANLLATTIAVSVMYKAGFFKSLAITVVSGLLTSIVTLVMVLSFATLFNTSAPKTNQPPPHPSFPAGQ